MAIPAFGGIDPGEIVEPDAVRAVATRRLAGMGVDTEAAAEWLANYSSEWVFASDAGGRRLAVLEEQGIHAEVAFPGPILAGGLSPAMYLGSQTSKNLEPMWPALHAYNRWLAELLCRGAGPAGRLHPHRLPRHGPGRRGAGLGGLEPASSAG